MILILCVFYFFQSPTEILSDILVENYRSAEKKYRISEFKQENELTQFLTAYFSNQSSQAIHIYETLFNTSNDKDIVYLSTKKLYEYNYAMGYYQSAERFLKLLSKHDKSLSIKSEFQNKKFQIQCGVFSNKENAELLKEKIARIGQFKVYLNQDTVNGITIYRVLIGDLLNLTEADSIKRKIDTALEIHSLIKQ